MSRQIVYEDISPTAASSAIAAASERQVFSDLPLLFQDGVEFKKFQTCEHNQTVLDGTFPSFVAEGNNFALWSISQSRADLTLESPVALQISFGGALQQSVGITIIADTLGNCWPTHINIKWYQSGALLSDMDFYPDSPRYSCINEVRHYTDLEITFYSLNFSGRFLKLQQIPFGIERVFGEDEIESFEVYEAVDLTGVTLSINTMNCAVSSHSDVAFMFQRRQPLSVVFNGTRYGSFYIDRWKQPAKKRFSLETVDYVGVLDSQADFMGGLYAGQTAGSVITDIVQNAKMVSIDPALEGIPIYGWLPISSRRDALAAVAVAIGAVIDTSRGKLIKIYPLPAAQNGNIPESRVYNDISRETDFPYTGINLTEHSFVEPRQSTGLVDQTLYEDLLYDTITLHFSSPTRIFGIQNGTIIKSGVNYATIQGISTTHSEHTILTGAEYRDVKKVVEINTPGLLENDQTKVISFDNLTLVGPHNSAAVAQRLYSYYVKGTKVNGSIILDGEKVTDIVEIAMPENETATGQIEKLTLALGARRIKAKAVLQSDE